MIIHCMIFCWPGQEQNTINLIHSLLDHVDRLTVIDASESIVPEQPLCEWVKLDKSYYYGMKFYSSLNIFEGDIFLQVQADAASTDWKTLVKRCRDAFLHSEIGIWAPDVNYSFWETELVQLTDTKIPELKQVVQTDCIVWAMSRNVVERMRKFNYPQNNLGWGIDSAAIAFCYANKLLVVRDTAIHVQHPLGTGYKQDEAAIQMKNFLSQLDYSEVVQHLLIQNTINLSQERLRHSRSACRKLQTIASRIKQKLISSKSTQLN